MKSIAAGYYHTIAILEDDTMEQWGQEDGQYNDFPEGEQVKAVSAGKLHSVAIKEDDTIIQWGVMPRAPKKPRGAVSLDGLKVKAISCGNIHTVAITTYGSIVQWGSEVTGQASGFPSKSVKAKMVSAGYAHNVAILENGSIIQWGTTTLDISQKIVHNPPKDKVKYVSSGFFHSVAIREDGSLIQWLLEDHKQNEGLPTEGVYKAVSCGSYHSVAIKEDGTIVQWGDSSQGQMKDFPPAMTKVAAVACGAYHTVAITEDGKLIQWGADTNNQRENMPESSGTSSNVPALQRLEEAFNKARKPNPYPELTEKITGEEMPRAALNYTEATTAFNAVMQNDIPIRNALSDEGNSLIVKVGDNYSLVDRDYIKNTIADFTGIRYACTKQLGLAVYPNNIYGNNPLYYMKGLAGGGNYLVLLAEIQKVLENNTKAIEIVPSVQLNAVSAFSVVYDDGDYNFLGKLVDTIGKDHCQKGTPQMLYRIRILEAVAGGRRKTQKRRNGLRRSVTHRSVTHRSVTRRSRSRK